MISQHYFTFPLYLPRTYGLLRNWPLYLRNYLFRRILPAEYILRNGWRLIDNAGTLAGTFAVVYLRREYGIPEGARVIIDVGANMGCFSLFAAQHAPKAKIYSYEPEPTNFSILSRNIAINGLHNNITARQCAVAGEAGDRELALGESPLNSLVINSGSQCKKLVQCVTLEQIIKDHNLDQVDILKLNCEGAEYEILNHCPDSVLRQIREIRLEYHNLDRNTQNGLHLASYLTKRGFSIQRFSKSRGQSGFIWAVNRCAVGTE